MSTYAESGYSSAGYATGRPTYSPKSPDFLVKYHKQIEANECGHVLDVATGTGIFARLISDRFRETTATDISKVMLESAAQPAKGKIEYIQGSAEDMSIIPDKSVDMVTVATGAHWFNSTKFLTEAKRVLKPNGTLAIFGYSGFGYFPKSPKCDKIMREFCMDKLGDYWDKGRNNLERLYSNYNIKTRQMGFKDVYHGVYPQQATHYTGCDSVVMDAPNIIDFKMTWKSLLKYLQTMSCVHNYHVEFPDERNVAEVAVERMMHEAGESDWDSILDFIWEQSVVLCRC
ncbi:putative S-adenosylmethionine-dependent methyltransferase CRG1 [Smittium culicis]|uniref:Putative S-adenosylmethionine-dependent methyltransferase CRG1 n=2 Tax=Smittium culicis TaxID=133412 RepID=A0A1R1XCW2_9FUNG|nr:putative S-adenosylmethionine-dependent methyltransferase CRG1 [Smittium culicis]